MGHGRLGRWWRWMRVPFTEPLLALGLVAAFAAPVLLVVAADAWRTGGADQAAAGVVGAASIDRVGIDLLAEVSFEGLDPASAGTMAAADRAVTDALGRIGVLEPAVRTLATFPSAARTGSPPEPVGVPVRLLAQPGVLEAVEVIDRAPDPADDADGVWISAWLAERTGVGVGDELTVELGAMTDDAVNDAVPGGGAEAVFEIAAVYTTAWSADDPDAPSPLDGIVPPEYVPRYVAPFNAPDFDLVLLEPAAMERSPLTGIARWIAPARELPTDLDGLLTVDRQYRAFESAVVRDTEVGDALAGIAAPGGARRPAITTDLHEIAADARRAAGRLDGPVGAARGLGLAVGAAAAAAGGTLLVARRRTDFRLRAVEGARWERIAAAVAGQLVAPVAIGAVLGSVAAVVIAAAFGPASDPVAVDWTAVVPVAGAAGLLAAASAGMSGQRTLAEAPAVPGVVVRLLPVAVALGVVALTWGPTGRPGADFDAGVVAFALALLLAASVLALLVSGWIARRLRPRADRFGVVGLIVVGRLASGTGALAAPVVALAAGLGLVVFAGTLADAVDRTTEVEAAATVGAETRLDLVDPVPEGADLPAGTARLWTQGTVATPGDTRVRIVAVDDDALVDAMAWPAEFGLDAATAQRLLLGGDDDAVPAIAVTGEGLAPIGAIGAIRTVPYEVVAEAGALPLAGTFGATLLVSASRLDEVDAARSAAAGSTGQPPATSRYRAHLVSRLAPDELVAVVDAADLQVRETLTVDAVRREPGRIALATAFDFVRVAGVVAAVAGLAALALRLDANRRDRALASVLTRAFGIPAGRSAWITTIEVAVVVSVATIAALVGAAVAVAHVGPAFDPAPEVPPDLSVDLPWLTLVAASVVVIAAVSALAWVGEMATARRPEAEVLRRAGA